MRIPALLLLTASSAALAMPGAAVQAACDPTLIQSPTKFPLQSQLRGQRGVVLLEVTVDEFGRVSGAQLLQSSGHKRLDRAASASIRERWVFDVTACERKDLPATDVVAIDYRNDEYGG